jgi:hypothetical protein
VSSVDFTGLQRVRPRCIHRHIHHTAPPRCEAGAVQWLVRMRSYLYGAKASGECAMNSVVRASAGSVAVHSMVRELGWSFAMCSSGSYGFTCTVPAASPQGEVFLRATAPRPLPYGPPSPRPPLARYKAVIAWPRVLSCRMPYARERSCRPVVERERAAV